jgi:HlyD family secretion protein
MPSTTSDDVRKVIGATARPWWKRVAWIVVAAAAALAIGMLVVRARRGAAASAGPAYELVAAKRSEVRVTVTATGTLQAVTTVEVGAEVTGKVLTVRVDANDTVKKGQILAEIDPEQLRAAVDEASAQVSSANASIRLAKATKIESALAAERARAQAAEQLISKRDLEAANAAAERAEANLQSATASATLANAGLKSARSKLAKTTIISPIDGIVLSRLVEPGATVTAGFTTPVLFKLAQDLTQMRLNVDIDESDIGRVREGLSATFTVDAFPEKTFPAKLYSLRNEPKTTSNVVTYSAVLSVDNAERLLRPGMTCTTTIVAETRPDVLVVPNAALRFAPPVAGGPGADSKKAAGVEGDRREKQRVFVLNGATPTAVPVAVPVRVGATDGIVSEIVSGDIQVGTQVITDVKVKP